MARLRVVGGRRLPALGVLLLRVGAAAARDGRARGRAAARARAMRIGAVGVLWAPVAVMIPAALEPRRAQSSTR